MDSRKHWEKLQESSKFIEDKISDKWNDSNASHRIGTVLGSGLGKFAYSLEDQLIIPFEEIPHFPKTGVAGHDGQLLIGRLPFSDESCKSLIFALQGRAHAYEGHPLEDVVFGIRTLKLCGAETCVITNASGSTHEGMEPGTLMLITDQINLTGRNPLLGSNLSELGPRFPDMSRVFQKELIETFEEVGTEIKAPIKKGVYAGVLGPSYETAAEIQMLYRLGADAVGMSTVLEVIAAKHAGMNLAGVSAICNFGTGIQSHPLSHEEVTENSQKLQEIFTELMQKSLRKIILKKDSDQ
jgi:purine-nucleoside phosphorylase